MPQFLDISRACPHCDALRDNVYIRAPPELGLEAGMCLRLKRSGHVTGDAPQAFEFAVRDQFLQNGFVLLPP